LGSEGGEWFVAHNEDYDPLFRHALSLVSFCPTRGPQFISTHYAGTLPGDGVALNQYGFCVSMNNIWRKRMPVTIGWTMQTIGFAFMQCRSWHEVLKIYRKVQANAGMHYLVVQGSEKAMSMEFFPDRKARRAVQPGFVHTNHPMLPEMRKGASVSANSKQRFMILSEQDASSLTNVRNCLRIPFGKGGVKRVFSKSGDDLTLATAIIIPGRRKLQIC
jgi:hypothetical protein